MSQDLIKSSQGAALIDGIHTDVVCTNFSDRLFIVITQYQKFGTLVSVTRDTVVKDGMREPTYSTNVLLGRDEPETHVIARNLASEIPVVKPLLFALALKQASPSVLRSLQQLLMTHACW
ncbi:Proteasome assembly chaperone 3 [Lamellibrachia satsuma]|nr:Proteasome assembly chaperone 3 [Lamellibrachia satsuma]